MKNINNFLSSTMYCKLDLLSKMDKTVLSLSTIVTPLKKIFFCIKARPIMVTLSIPKCITADKVFEHTNLSILEISKSDL